MTQKQAQAGAHRAVEFLCASQLPNGAFRTLRGTDAQLTDGIEDASPFVTTFVLEALVASMPRRIATIDRASSFLRGEVEPGGMWRYWSRGHWKYARVPPDLDDTATACAALRAVGHRVPTNAWVFRACQDPAGRFYTWIVPRPGSPLRLRGATRLGDLLAAVRTPPTPETERANPRFAERLDRIVLDDVDPVVNANVVRYLGEQEMTSRAIGWLLSLIAGTVSPGYSLYYSSPLALYHAIARAFGAGCRSLGTATAGIMAALGRIDPRPLASLELALVAATRLTLAPGDATGIAAVHALLERQRNDGSWERHALYGGPFEYWGSEELTTAVALDALRAALSSPDHA